MLLEEAAHGRLERQELLSPEEQVVHLDQAVQAGHLFLEEVVGLPWLRVEVVVRPLQEGLEALDQAVLVEHLDQEVQVVPLVLAALEELLVLVALVVPLWRVERAVHLELVEGVGHLVQAVRVVHLLQEVQAELLYLEAVVGACLWLVGRVVLLELVGAKVRPCQVVVEALLARSEAQVVHLDQLELEVPVAPLSLAEAAELLSHQLHQVQEEQVHLSTEAAEGFLLMVALVALPCQEEQEELLVPVVEAAGLHEPLVREESPYQELVEALYHSEQEGSAE